MSTRESRPVGAAPESATTGPTIPPTSDTSVLDALNGDFMAGWLSGHLEGLDRGREQAEAEIATLQRRAAEVVHGLANIDPWPEQVERARKAQEAAVERFRAAARKGSAS